MASGDNKISQESAETLKNTLEDQGEELPRTESVQQTIDKLFHESEQQSEETTPTVTLIVEGDSDRNEEEEPDSTVTLIVEKETDYDEEEEFTSSQIVMLEEIECEEEESVLVDQSNESVETNLTSHQEESTGNSPIVIVVEESATADQLIENVSTKSPNQAEESSAEMPIIIDLEEDSAKESNENDASKESAKESNEDDAPKESARESNENDASKESVEESNENDASKESATVDQENRQGQKRKIISIERGKGGSPPNIKVKVLSNDKSKSSKLASNKVHPKLGSWSAGPKNSPLLLPKPTSGSSVSTCPQTALGKNLKKLLFQPVQAGNSIKFELQPSLSDGNNSKTLVKDSPLKSAKTVVSGSTTPAQPLQQVQIPSNYALVRTNVGLALMPADQIKDAGVKKTFMPSNLTKLNSEKTTNLPLLTPINTSSLPIVSALKLPTSVSTVTPVTVSQPIAPVSLPKFKLPVQNIGPTGLRPILPGKLPLQRFPPSTIINKPPPSRINSNTVRISLGSSSSAEDKKSKTTFPFDVCQHPTCTAYRDKLDEDLRIKLHMRARKIKSLRMAKQRCIRRAVLLEKTIRNLRKQKELSDIVEYQLPEGLSKEMLRMQLKPNSKPCYNKELKEFGSRLHSISPKAYDIVREMFSNVLPQPKSIQKWIMGSDQKEDFTTAETAAETAEEVEDEGDDSESDVEMAEVDGITECTIEDVKSLALEGHDLF